MKSYEILGWAYEADLHCYDCAEKRFGVKKLENGDAKDSEGNEVHPIFASNETIPFVCGTCGKEIGEIWDDDFDIEENFDEDL